MSLKPKFKVGDKVFHIYVAHTSEKVRCPDCLGKKKWKVTTPSGEEWSVECKTCYAGWDGCTGMVDDWGDRIIKTRLTIGSVRTDTADRERPISYMCDETGVGTGSVYNEISLFAVADEEAADAFGAEELIKYKGRKQKEVDEENKRRRKEIYKPSKR